MSESETFLPYRSPVFEQDPKKQAQFNLTGHLRKLKDIGADVHNTLEKWELFNSKGHSIMCNIVNVKLQYICKQYADSTEEAEDKSTIVSLSLSLEAKCKELQQVCESLEETVDKLASLASITRAIQTLRQHKRNADTVVCLTWTVHQFVDTLDALHTVYAKELNLKKEVCRNVAHAETHQSLMFHSASWVHQPYIDSKMMVEALLLETGHQSVT